jgi:NAD(P)-dependent dehydrogenase (short-subunit alcohol dehydrogenase family)
MIKDKIAVVTGMASGLGKSIIEIFSRHGAHVVGCDRTPVAGQQVIDTLTAEGARALYIPCDVSKEEEVRSLVARVIEAFGRIDILVNNAGVNFAQKFEEMTSADWDRVMDTDLRGTFLCCHATIPEMLKTGGGSIINIGSVHTVACFPGAAPYDAAKFGVVGLSKALAVEFGDRNIRVNVLSPGACATQMWEDLKAAAPNPQLVMDHWNANIPMQRPGEPEEVAKVALFLASDLSSYMTGANVLLDGGLTSQLVSKASFEIAPVEGK